MKKQILTFIILIVLSSNIILGQASISIRAIAEKYEAFEYQEVILQSEKVFRSGVNLTRMDSLEILTMSAASYFAISEKDSARNKFIKILQIDKKHKLNPQKISPKIINYFEQVKRDFYTILNSIPKRKKHIKKSIANKPNLILGEKNIVQTSLARSLLLPGMGHLYLGDKTQGWILTSASTLTLGSMIYFIFETKNKEAEYLNEIDMQLVKQKYKDYNTAYKIRNSLIISYAAIWLYSQIDLLFFSDELISTKMNTTTTQVLPGVYEQKYLLSVKIRL